MYRKKGHPGDNFAGKTRYMIKNDIIKSPEGVRNLMAELWANHVIGMGQSYRRVFMVNFPEPTEEERRIMTANHKNRKPFVMDEDTLNTALENAAGKLGGW